MKEKSEIYLLELGNRVPVITICVQIVNIT